MIDDALLAWLSELGSGRWSDVRSAIGHANAGRSDQRPAWIIARNLCDLGHLEVCWEEDAWRMAPPTINLLRGSAGVAVWTGSRPRAAQRQLLDELMDDIAIFPFTVLQPGGPDAAYLKGGSVHALRDAASALGVSFQVDPSHALAEAMPAVSDELGEERPRPAQYQEIERYDSRALEWQPSPRADMPGLYRIKDRGRRIPRWRGEGDRWFDIDLAGGVNRSLSAVARARIISHRLGSAGEGPALLVRDAYPLPPLAARSATAALGLLPMRANGWRVYENVQRRTARLIADKLSLPLAED